MTKTCITLCLFLCITFSINFVGLDGVFVGSGIFKSGNPAERARAIVQAVTHYKDAKLLAEVSIGLGLGLLCISSSCCFFLEDNNLMLFLRR